MTCRKVPCATIRLILLLGFFYPAACPAEPTGKQGKITGESYANLRSGPDLSFPTVAVVKQGDIFTLEGEEKTWYRVALSNGVRGYIHKTLVHPVVDPEARRELPPSSPQPAPKERKIESLPALSTKLSTTQRSWRDWKWIAMPLCLFALGWILGGNYYLWRDHRRRHKLHL